MTPKGCFCREGRLMLRVLAAFLRHEIRHCPVVARPAPLGTPGGHSAARWVNITAPGEQPNVDHLAQLCRLSGPCGLATRVG